ncbi:MAG: small, acid-soluble spore protein, alpha/beta type [Candidatus Limiplasma sp.]|nr:small, acid-soluble spore protein, alpha/beta type [Candidatus Limiplasma sp.]
MAKHEEPSRLGQRALRKSALSYLSAQERKKYELAQELGLLERVKDVGWAGLSAKETGRIGGLIGQGNRKRPPQP